MKHPTALRSITYHGLEDGPRLIVLGAVHGNETCGTQAIGRVLADLDAGRLELARGQLTFVPVANPLAHALGQRSGERNLNRNFRISARPEDFEDRVANRLGPLLRDHDVLLDLHSFHTAGEPFVMLGPRDNDGELEPFDGAREEEALALRLGARRFVEGWLDTYARGVARRLRNPNASLRAQMLSTDPAYGVGTTEFMRAHGGRALTLECGQHDDPKAPEVAHRAILNTLAHLKLLDRPDPQPVRDAQVLRLVEVVDREHPDDTFARPWKSFDPVAAGEVIGRRAGGEPVTAPTEGFIVFPNPNAQPGNEWFYRAEFSDRFQGR
ncbi:succinylglutamate desuccinylase/aspartoacylase domain-containing protein [Ectothiorhodospira mobilis]|uniref:succinylglutamate desuccinylase/aspartoacylase domain-containing protein n=1 Tax=Ectothiorhodospira mobilis TaxID=195064 RepID=UPI001EE7FAF2|nr:succinylglutamate desuccinylase/aspartoacylase family protein [Ectothiorhodospira mobilis]MCG5535934.1 succinylglutamate desuccinylase/aspartoacylase family protein [Ectothiorhodospira mobilis]